MTSLTCVSVTGCHAGLALLERLALGPTDLAPVLPRLRARAGVDQIAVLSTCQRVEVYAVSAQPLDPRAVVRALAQERGVPLRELEAGADVRTGPDAVHHLLRVSAGLTSFVLGEREIVGQVRSAAETARAAQVTGPELDRLFATAVNASRRVHRATSFAAATRSVAGAAMDHLVRRGGGSLHGRRLLVVGAGEVAVVVVDHAVAAGAEVTVANRTLRRAQRLRDAGARVVDLAELDAWLGAVDVAVFATAAPHPLVDARTLRRVSTEPGLLLVDLSMPRNVSPDCRAVPGVEVLDLHDLEEVAARGPASVVRDVDTAERLVGEEADRYARWLATRTAAVHVRRLREDADAAARDEARRIRGRVPPELQGLVEQALLRTAHRLAHGATALMLEAAVDGDTGLVDRLAVVFAEPDLAPAAPEELAQTG